MAFALIAPDTGQSATTRPISWRGSGDEYRDHARRTIEARKRIVGVITLHSTGEDSVGFSKGWIPVVNYLQSYLAQVLIQVARLAGRETTAKDLLLHEVTNVVNSTKTLADDTNSQVQELRQGNTNRLAIKWKEKLEHLDLSHQSYSANIYSLNAQDALELLDLSSRIVSISSTLASRHKRIAELTPIFKKLVEKLQQEESYSTLRGLGMANLELAELIYPAPYLRDLFRNHRKELTSQGRYARLNPSNEEPRPVRTYRLLWDLIFENIIINQIKYSLKDSVPEVSISGSKVFFRNEGLLAESENTLSLLEFGKRGKNYKNIGGKGLGLGIVKLASEFCNIGFEFSAVRVGKRHGIPDVAEFTVELDLSMITERS